MVIATDGLTKRFGSTIALDALTLTVAPGEVFGFIGPNGAGKSTAIRILLDLIRPTSGTATVFGQDVRERSLEIRRRIGYLPGDLSLFDTLTVERYLDWWSRLRGETARDGDVLCERLHLDTSRRIADLSTGNRQKVGLVQAFMHAPELLVLDEPTSGLDPIMQREFRDMVAEARGRGTTVFLSSHDLSEVEHVCDRVGMIDRGRLRKVAGVEDLRQTVGKRVELRVAAPAEAAVVESLVGVSNVRRSDDGPTIKLDFVFRGDVNDLLGPLRDIELLDFVCEARSLEEFYLGEFGDELEPTALAAAS